MLDIIDEVLGADTRTISICSAHRNPEDLAIFAKEAYARGTTVFIGVAGMAAALPGALAGGTRMMRLIIGVPLDEHGIDSCLYMPPGVPVATAGVGKTGLKQAALIACQVLSINNNERASRLLEYIKRTTKKPQFDVSLEEDAS